MDRKLNILVCSNYDSSWNSVRPEAELFIELAKLGHKVTIMTKTSAAYCDRFLKYGIKVIDSYPKRKICTTTIKQIRAELNSKQYDILYAFNSKTIPNAAFAAIGFKVKVVAYRGTVRGLSRIDPTSYLTALHPRVNGIVCVSDSVTQSVHAKLWSSKSKSNAVTIYKGHDLLWYENKKQLQKSDLQIPDTAIVGVCVANARASKGVDVLINATHFVSSSNFYLLLVGDNMDSYNELIQSSPMADRILNLGYREDVPLIMEMSDIQIQPSRGGEGLPKTIIEAMAYATATITTDAGGCLELIDDEITGLVVPRGDAEALGKAINRLVLNPDQITHFGEGARVKLVKEFSLTASVKKHLMFFNDLLTQR